MASEANPCLAHFQIDANVSGMFNEATRGHSLLAMMGGGLAYRFGRFAAFGFFSPLGALHPSLQILPRILAPLLGLSLEVSAYEGISRGLGAFGEERFLNPNLLSWDGSNGIWAGLRNSFVSFGTLKLGGQVFHSQNIFAQHLTQDITMVLSHQTLFRLGLSPEQEGSFFSQLFEAEACNLGMGTGLFLAGLFSGHRLQRLERRLESQVDWGRYLFHSNTVFQSERAQVMRAPADSLTVEVMRSLGLNPHKESPERFEFIFAHLRSAKGATAIDNALEHIGSRFDNASESERRSFVSTLLDMPIKSNHPNALHRVHEVATAFYFSLEAEGRSELFKRILKTASEKTTSPTADYNYREKYRARLQQSFETWSDAEVDMYIEFSVKDHLDYSERPLVEKVLRRRFDSDQISQWLEARFEDPRLKDPSHFIEGFHGLLQNEAGLRIRERIRVQREGDRARKDESLETELMALLAARSRGEAAANPSKPGASDLPPHQQFLARIQEWEWGGLPATIKQRIANRALDLILEGELRPRNLAAIHTHILPHANAERKARYLQHYFARFGREGHGSIAEQTKALIDILKLQEPEVVTRFSRDCSAKLRVALFENILENSLAQRREGQIKGVATLAHLAEGLASSEVGSLLDLLAATSRHGHIYRSNLQELMVKVAPVLARRISEEDARVWVEATVPKLVSPTVDREGCSASDLYRVALEYLIPRLPLENRARALASLVVEDRAKYTWGCYARATHCLPEPLVLDRLDTHLKNLSSTHQKTRERAIAWLKFFCLGPESPYYRVLEERLRPLLTADDSVTSRAGFRVLTSLISRLEPATQLYWMSRVIALMGVRDRSISDRAVEVHLELAETIVEENESADSGSLLLIAEEVVARREVARHVEIILPEIAAVFDKVVENRPLDLPYLLRIAAGLPGAETAKIYRLRNLAIEIDKVVKNRFRRTIHNRPSKANIAFIERHLVAARAAAKPNSLLIAQLEESHALAVEIYSGALDLATFKSQLSTETNVAIRLPENNEISLEDAAQLALRVREHYLQGSFRRGERVVLLRLLSAINLHLFSTASVEEGGLNPVIRSRRMSALVRVLHANGYGNASWIRLAEELENLCRHWDERNEEYSGAQLQILGALCQEVVMQVQEAYHDHYDPLMEEYGEMLGFNRADRGNFAINKYRTHPVFQLASHLQELQVILRERDAARSSLEVLTEPQTPPEYRPYFFHSDDYLPGRRWAGGKGSELRWLAQRVPDQVPEGFTLPALLPEQLESCPWEASLLRGLEELETRTGRRLGKDLWVSVRSGAAVSMPGMMDTVLFTGREVLERIEAIRGEPYSDEERRDIILCEIRDAARQVYGSWNNDSASGYRRRGGIPDFGSAVHVVEMISAENGGAGIATALGIDYGQGVQGDVLVSGHHQGRDPLPPELEAELRDSISRFERERRYPVEIEYTIRKGKLYYLQIRRAHYSYEELIQWTHRARENAVLNSEEAITLLGGKSRLRAARQMRFLEVPEGEQPILQSDQLGLGEAFVGMIANDPVFGEEEAELYDAPSGIQRIALLTDADAQASANLALDAGAAILLTPWDSPVNPLSHLMAVARSCRVPILPITAAEEVLAELTLGMMISVEPQSGRIFGRELPVRNEPSPHIHLINALLNP